MSELDTERSNNGHIDCSFEIFAAGTIWGSVTGDIENQTDLQDILTDLQSDIDDVTGDLSIETDNRQSADTDLQDNIDTVDGKIDTHIADKTNPHEVTKTQVGLGDVDNTSDLNKPISTATQTALNGKQNTINDLSEIRSNASDGQSAYNTIQTYGDIVTYDASNFATSTQGSKADTALQPNDNISELNNDAGYITSASLPTVNNSTVKFQKNGTDVETITLNQSSNATVNFSIPTQASDINAVPTSRKVNNKALSSDITLTASDVNALSSSTTINDLTTTAQQNALNSGITSNDVTLIGTALQPNDNVSSLINDAGYITSSSLPTVNNGTLTIQQNGTDVQTFTANQSSNATANIITPTKTSDLTNDSGFIDNSALSNYATQTDLTNGLATKQNTISDLSTIRSNASAGATAVQPSDLATVATSGSYNDLLNKPTIPTQTDVQINGTSITSGGTANIVTNSAYNSSSNKIATMSDLPADEIFIATYGTTTYQEVLAAYNAGKTIVCLNSTTNVNYYYKLVYKSSSSFMFAYCLNNDIDTVSLSETNGWGSINSRTLLQSEYVTHQTIWQTSSDAQGTLALFDNISLYKIVRYDTASSITIVFDTSYVNFVANNAYTFELLFEMSMSPVITLSFPNSVTWQGGETPDMSETGTYYFVFRTVDAGTTWHGNLEGRW